MDKEAEIKAVIQEYRESRERIRAVIQEYEDTEYRLFKVMLDKINAISDRAHSAQINSELAAALD